MPKLVVELYLERALWMSILTNYANGKKWNTGGIWVCESHPHLPCEDQGYTFDCNCGAPGMPPFCRISKRK